MCEMKYFWTSVNVISYEQPMDVFIFICSIGIHVYFLYNYYLHLFKMFIVWLPSAYSLNHYIYNQTVLPVNVLLSCQEIFLPNTCFVCNVVYLNLHEIWCKLCTFKLKYFNCSSPQLVWGVLILLKYHLQKNILNPLLFKLLCQIIIYFFLHICTCICWNACMVTLMPFFKLLYSNFSVKLTIDIKVN